MNKLKFAVKGLLAMAVAATGAVSCNNAEKTPEAVVAAPTVTEAPAGCRIAYFDADSVLRAYRLAQELNAESQRLMNQLQQNANVRQQELQAMAAQIEQKRQNNIYLSEVTFQQDVNNLQNRQAQAEQHLNAQQEQLSRVMAAAQARLNDSLNNCVRDINAVLGYDAILFRESGVYFNPALDITDQIITVLNARYDASNPATAQ